MLRGAPDSERFSLPYYRSGRLIAVDAVNAPRDCMAVRKILEVGRTIPPRIAADPDVALKEFLRAGAQRLGRRPRGLVEPARPSLQGSTTAYEQAAVDQLDADVAEEWRGGAGCREDAAAERHLPAKLVEIRHQLRSSLR